MANTLPWEELAALRKRGVVVDPWVACTMAAAVWMARDPAALLPPRSQRIARPLMWAPWASSDCAVAAPSSIAAAMRSKAAAHASYSGRQAGPATYAIEVISTSPTTG